MTESIPETLARLRALRADLAEGVAVLEAIESRLDRSQPVWQPAWGLAARTALEVLDRLRVWEQTPCGTRAATAAERERYGAIQVVYFRPEVSDD